MPPLPMPAAGFIYFPVVLCQSSAPWQFLIYQLAYEQAEKAQRSRSIYDRDLFSIMN